MLEGPQDVFLIKGLSYFLDLSIRGLAEAHHSIKIVGSYMIYRFSTTTTPRQLDIGQQKKA